MPAITSNTPDPTTLPAYLTNPWIACAGTGGPQAATIGEGTLLPGCVLGQVTSTGYFVLCDRTPVAGAPQTDGRQIPVAVLASVAVPATSTPAMIWTAGSFRTPYLLWHSSWSQQDIVNALHLAGLFCFTGRTSGRSTGIF
jgi:hypothetical protein